MRGSPSAPFTLESLMKLCAMRVPGERRVPMGATGIWFETSDMLCTSGVNYERYGRWINMNQTHRTKIEKLVTKKKKLLKHSIPTEFCVYAETRPPVAYFYVRRWWDDVDRCRRWIWVKYWQLDPTQAWSDCKKPRLVPSVAAASRPGLNSKTWQAHRNARLGHPSTVSSIGMAKAWKKNSDCFTQVENPTALKTAQLGSKKGTPQDEINF